MRCFTIGWQGYTNMGLPEIADAVGPRLGVAVAITIQQQSLYISMLNLAMLRPRLGEALHSIPTQAFPFIEVP